MGGRGCVITAFESSWLRLDSDNGVVWSLLCHRELLLKHFTWRFSPRVILDDHNQDNFNISLGLVLFATSSKVLCAAELLIPLTSRVKRFVMRDKFIGKLSLISWGMTLCPHELFCRCQTHQVSFIDVQFSQAKQLRMSKVYFSNNFSWTNYEWVKNSGHVKFQRIHTNLLRYTRMKPSHMHTHTHTHTHAQAHTRTHAHTYPRKLKLNLFLSSQDTKCHQHLN